MQIYEKGNNRGICYGKKKHTLRLIAAPTSAGSRLGVEIHDSWVMRKIIPILWSGKSFPLLMIKHSNKQEWLQIVTFLQAFPNWSVHGVISFNRLQWNGVPKTVFHWVKIHWLANMEGWFREGSNSPWRSVLSHYSKAWFIHTSHECLKSEQGCHSAKDSTIWYPFRELILWCYEWVPKVEFFHFLSIPHFSHR